MKANPFNLSEEQIKRNEKFIEALRSNQYQKTFAELVKSETCFCATGLGAFLGGCCIDGSGLVFPNGITRFGHVDHQWWKEYYGWEFEESFKIVENPPAEFPHMRFTIVAINDHMNNYSFDDIAFLLEEYLFSMVQSVKLRRDTILISRT